jgi:hypothetical protein
MTQTATRRAARRPLTAVQVTAEHVAYNQTLGMGTLDIVAASGAAPTYLVFANRDRGCLLGLRLLKLSDGARHDIDLTAAPWRCDCGDATHRPDRPGGCRHVAALRQAAEKLRRGGGKHRA